MHLLYGFILFGLLDVYSAILLDGQQSGEIDIQQTVSDLVKRMQQVETTLNSCSKSVAFMAQLSANLDNPAVGHVVVFDDVSINEGGGYNSVHGIFTAPLNGTYFFSLVVSSPPEVDSSHEFHLAIMKNNTQAAYVFLDHNTTYWFRRSENAILHLTQGDEIWVQMLTSVDPIFEPMSAKRSVKTGQHHFYSF